MIKVLIVEDSVSTQELFAHIFSLDKEIQVVGIASNGYQAIEMTQQKKPDIITMDIHLPKMDGLAATRKIMETYPTPIIIVSNSFLPGEASRTFYAMEAGALAILQKPSGFGHKDFRSVADEFIKTVRLMSEVKVVKRWPYRKITLESSPSLNLSQQVSVSKNKLAKIKIVAIGASTGGPLVLQKILRDLGNDFSVPVLIVQHIAVGFLDGFVEWLSQTTGLPVHIAINGEVILPGNVYVAPDELHMGVQGSFNIALSNDEPENNLRPSVSYLFRSVEKIFGSSAVGVLLSGMGKDGAKELKLMKEAGAVTIAQDAESSVVFGMPGEAIRLDGASYVLSPGKIAEALKMLTNNK